MGIFATILAYASPSNVLAAAPLVEEGFKLFVERFLPIRGFAFLDKALKDPKLPDKKLHDVGADETGSMKNLERYVDYAGRIESTSQGSLLAVVSIGLVEYEHDPTLVHFPWYLILLALVLGNLFYLWYRLAIDDIDAIRQGAGAIHSRVLALFSIAIIAVNMHFYPPP
jgi:hypothetical protein